MMVCAPAKECALVNSNPMRVTFPGQRASDETRVQWRTGHDRAGSDESSFPDAEIYCATLCSVAALVRARKTRVKLSSRVCITNPSAHWTAHPTDSPRLSASAVNQKQMEGRLPRRPAFSWNVERCLCLPARCRLHAQVG